MPSCCPVCGGHHAHNHSHVNMPVPDAVHCCGHERDNAHDTESACCSGSQDEEADQPPAAACGCDSQIEQTAENKTCCDGHDHSGSHDSCCGTDRQHEDSHEHGSCCGHDHSQENYDPADLSGVPVSGKGVAVYRIDNMDCPMEEALIRNKLAGMAGIGGLEFNLMKRILTVRHTLDSTDEIEEALNAVDMKPVPITGGQTFQEAPAVTPWKRFLIAGLLALGAEAAHFAAEAPSAGQWLDWAAPALAIAAILVGGLSTYKKGWIALKNFNLNMNALMSFAVTGAMIIGQWPEAAMVMVLFNVAETIEAKSLARARNAIDSLLKMAPEMATVKQPDGSWAEVTATEVAVGSLVRVRPGERVALDGTILSGASALNQASITGESLPVEKGPGDQVYAGTVNESGSFEYEVRAAWGNSTLARIIKAVEEAQSSRAPMQRFVDKFAAVYTPIVFVAALLIGILPPLLSGGDWLGWAYKGLVLLVIACPCALVISTPVTIVSGLAAATRHGLLIKGGAFLEEGRKLTILALDKTGTITTGRPEQTDMLSLDAANGDLRETRLIAASLAGRSDHPVSKAIFTAARKDGLNPTLEIGGFKALPGLGIEGQVKGRSFRLGNHKMIHESGFCSAQLEKTIDDLENQGKSVVGLVGDEGVKILFAVADTIKESSRKAVSSLKALGLETVMLTGDNQRAALAVAAEAGVDDARGDLLPQDKLAAVEELAGRGHIVGMVGDGINDAPALAKAHIGFAMGAAGTDTAIETADVALMDDDPEKLATFVKLSRATHNILVQNISLAVGIKLLFFVLTFFGRTTMWMAVFADIGVSLMVVANGLRMLRR